MTFEVKEGIKANNVDKYKTFGNIALNYKLLFDNWLIVRHKKGYTLNTFKKTKISDDLRDGILYIFDTNTINYVILREMSDNEKQLFTLLMNKSGLKNDLKFDVAKLKDEKTELKNKFRILQGEIGSGMNNSLEAIEELKDVMLKMVEHNIISNEDHDEILQELSTL